jgi:AAA family ATP:ADP antiporter
MDVHRYLRDAARGAAALRCAGLESDAGTLHCGSLPFFVANLALFWLLLTAGVATVIVARVFFVWVSVFNLFAVAVFWSFMADLFTSEQGKRLFGFVGAGGTAGSLAGPAVTISLSVPLGPTNLLIAAIVFLELAVLCVHQLERSGNARQSSRPNEQRIGGSAFAAASELIYSPYLLGVAVWVSLLSFGATILYFQQAHIVAATVHDAGAQTRIFASIDLAVGLLTLATQVSSPLGGCSSGSVLA